MQTANLGSAVTQLADKLTPGALSLLETIVNIDSPSNCPEGAKLVQDVIASRLADVGCDLAWHAVDPRSSNRFVLEGTYHGSAAPSVALMGHVDTVFPVGTSKLRPYRIAGGEAFGPGVSDMKSGLALIVATASAISMLAENAPVPSLRIILSSDEELGTPYSKPVLRRLLAGSKYAFNAEPARPSGAVVVSRRGSAHLTVNVSGIEAHSGTSFSDGRSAISSLANIILELDRLNQEPGTETVNVGIVAGGTATNVVAGQASAKVHLTFETRERGTSILDKAKEAVRRAAFDGTKSELTGDISFLPMPFTPDGQRLFELYARAAKAIGSEATYEHAAGAADSGIPATMGIPTLCGVGPSGGNWHTDRESVRIADFAPRLATLVLSLLMIAGGAESH